MLLSIAVDTNIATVIDLDIITVIALGLNEPEFHTEGLLSNVNHVEMYEAQLTRKSLSLTVMENLLPSCKIPNHMDSC